jgi:hypothetical protein
MLLDPACTSPSSNMEKASNLALRFFLGVGASRLSLSPKSSRAVPFMLASLRLRGVFAGVLSMPKVSLLDVRLCVSFSGRISVSESEAGSGDPRGSFVVRGPFDESLGLTKRTRFDGELGEDGGEKVWFELRVRGFRIVAGGVDDGAKFLSGDELKRGLGVPPLVVCCAATRLDLLGEYGS